MDLTEALKLLALTVAIEDGQEMVDYSKVQQILLRLEAEAAAAVEGNAQKPEER
jgi:hypothetical protein